MLGRRKTVCNGKIVIVDFRKLNPRDFEPIHHLDKKGIREELALCAQDGKIYINSRHEGAEILSDVLELLMKENKSTLLEYQDFIGRQYPNIKSFDDFITWSENNTNAEDRMQVFAILTIPIELQRRKIEQLYNGKIVEFPS